MKKSLGLVCLFLAAGLLADEVIVQGGTVLKGKISSISDAIIEIETEYAGPLQVDRAKVTGFSTEDPVFVRLASGAVMPGTVSASDEGTLKISGVDGVLSAPLSSVRQGWVEPGNDPEILAREKAAAELERKWKYQVSANINGKSGNTDEQSIGANFSATLAGKYDELKFYGLYNRQTTDGVKSSDERKVGTRYTSYFNDPWGWYVRQELENDEFENIKLRSVTAGGLSYRFADEDHYKLSANSGLSYRYESYDDGTPAKDSVGLDIGLQHFYRFKNNFEINNELTYIPSVEDFANYLLTQNSWIDFPLGDSKLWKVRMGLRNDYNSEPEGGRKTTDTTYYSSFVAEWD
jgi:putative salt-induced outer membrane protein YdiY